MKSTRVSVCIIAKNCADIIPVTLRWATANFEEINIVCDTENVDNTIEILESWGDKITLKFHEFDNFSSQKNRAFAMATKPWVLSVDSDEIFEDDIPWDGITERMEKLNKDLGAFQLYNIQRDLDHYKLPLLPKPRLVRADNARMDGKPVDEEMNLDGVKPMMFPYAHIHFGHIRNKEALHQKGKDRIQWKDADPSGGPGLREHGENWFIARNEMWDKNIAPVPPWIRKTIKRYWNEGV